MTKKFEVLIPYYQSRSNGESDKAKALFMSFLSGNFSYDTISNHPDYMVYASAETLAMILPLIIEEMLKRKDTDNFLAYHIFSSIDPTGSKDDSNNERAKKLVTLADKSLVNKICSFLNEVKSNPPNSTDQIERLLKLWTN